MSNATGNFADHDCGGDAAAYVLGALEESEVEAFREHMTSCIVCRDEVTALRQVADALPAAAPVKSVPRSLRRRVVSEVRADARKRGRGRRSLLPTVLHTRALAGALAAALALVVILALSSGGSGGARVITARVSVPAASAALRVSGGHAELVVRKLPAPPPGHIYEVWLQRGASAPSPTRALFSVTAHGAGDIGVPGSLHGITAVLVTAEPAGGSLVPTRAPLIVARLT